MIYFKTSDGLTWYTDLDEKTLAQYIERGVIFEAGATEENRSWRIVGSHVVGYMVEE